MTDGEEEELPAPKKGTRMKTNKVCTDIIVSGFLNDEPSDHSAKQQTSIPMQT